MRPTAFPAPSRTRRKGLSISLPATVLLVLALAGCGPGGAQPTASPASPAAAATVAPSSPSPSPAAVSFPLTVTDHEGTSVTLERVPERVVSLSPATTETLFALGVGEKVVGGTDFDDYPPEARALPDVASYQGVVVEKVIDLDPDLVFAAGDLGQSPAAERLRALGVAVIVVAPATVDEILDTIRLTGRAVGAGAQAENLTAEMEARMEAISAAARAQGTRPRVFYELGAESDVYGLTDGSYTADLVEMAGGEPITTGSRTDARMPLERLVAADPEVIVLGDANYGTTPAAVAKRGGGWQRMTAVKQGAIRPVDDIIVTRPGPRLPEGLAALARAIHPEIELPSPSP